MRSRDTLIRLKRFQVDEKRRRVAQTESMIADFERMCADLDREIASEEAKSGISDTSHFAYPTYAKAAMTRRDNIRQSIANLQIQLEQARAELQDAYEELKKVEILDDREHSRDRSVKAMRDQLEMDRIGLNRSTQFSPNR
jgi:flagellar FliJ protein